MLRDLFSLFPAYAGVILMVKSWNIRDQTFPRIRGGDPRLLPLIANFRSFSPHTRG